VESLTLRRVVRQHSATLTQHAGEFARKRRQASFALAVSSVVGAALIWSSSYTMTKVALRQVPPFTIGLLRFTLAAALLGVLLRLRPHGPRPGPRDLLRLAGGGLLGITLYFAIENLGVDLATASDAALLVAAYPAITISLELLIYRRTAMLAKLFGVSLAVIGVYLIVRDVAQSSSSHRLAGDILLIVSGVVWSFYNFSTRQLGDRYPTLVVVFYQTLAGAIAFLPLAWLEHARWRTPSLTAGLSIIHLGVFCSVAAFFLYAFGLKRLDASTAVGLLNLVPIFGVAFSSTFLREPVGTLQLLGGAIVIVGITLVVRVERRLERRRRELTASPAIRSTTP
jgi:drug/metabolite transporter (DMT)-like permease